MPKIRKASQWDHVSIKSDGHSNNTNIVMSDGTPLGLVQEITWHAKVGEQATCVIHTIITPADLKVLTTHVDIKFTEDKHAI